MKLTRKIKMASLMKLLGLGLFLPLSFAHADDKTIDLLWKARGIQAQERIEKLPKGKKKGTAQDTCDAILAFAFAENAFLKSDLNKNTSGEITGRIQHLTLVGPNAKSKVTIRFFYDEKAEISQTDSFEFIEISNASLRFLKGMHGIEMNGCTYLLNEDPLKIEPLKVKK